MSRSRAPYSPKPKSAWLTHHRPICRQNRRQDRRQSRSHGGQVAEEQLRQGWSAGMSPSHCALFSMAHERDGVSHDIASMAPLSFKRIASTLTVMRSLVLSIFYRGAPLLLANSRDQRLRPRPSRPPSPQHALKPALTPITPSSPAAA